MGFQEITEALLEKCLLVYFSDDYDYVSQWRAEGRKEGLPIFWKKDKFSLVDHGFFWLSETPNKESMGWDAEYPRLTSWVKLRVKATGKEFLFYNTHYDFSGRCHLNSSDVILQQVRAQEGFTKYGVILAGDMNMLPWTVGYLLLTAKGELQDINAALQNDNTSTFNGFEKEGTGYIIDYCFYSPAKMLPLHYEVMPGKVDGEWVSDHNGLYAEVALL